MVTRKGNKMEQRETYYECYENQEWDKLIKYCLEELKNDPEDDSLLWQLGDAYLESGNYQRALELGKYHYQIHPESPNATQIIVTALEGLEEPVENFSWKGSPKILGIEEAVDKIYGYMLHKRGRKKAIGVCDLYSGLSRDNEFLIGFSLRRFEEKIRTDKRFDVGEIGDILLAKSRGKIKKINEIGKTSK